VLIEIAGDHAASDLKPEINSARRRMLFPFGIRAMSETCSERRQPADGAIQQHMDDEIGGPAPGQRVEIARFGGVDDVIYRSPWMAQFTVMESTPLRTFAGVHHSRLVGQPRRRRRKGIASASWRPAELKSSAELTRCPVESRPVRYDGYHKGHHPIAVTSF
jgi:hypothetical protein